MKPMKIGIATALAVAIIAGFRLAELRSPKESPKVAVLPEVRRETSLPQSIPDQKPPASHLELERALRRQVYMRLYASPNPPASDLGAILLEHQKALDPLKLTDQQIDRMLDVMLVIAKARSAYEATIATVTVLSPEITLIKVPPYPIEGQVLQEQMHAKMDEAIADPQKASVVWNEISAALRSDNCGFGEAAQETRLTLRQGLGIAYEVDIKVGIFHEQLPDHSVRTVDYGRKGFIYPSALGYFDAFSSALPKGGKS